MHADVASIAQLQQEIGYESVFIIKSIYGLARKAAAAGVRIFTATEVSGFQSDAASLKIDIDPDRVEVDPYGIALPQVVVDDSFAHR